MVEEKTQSIFISYRRSDSAGYAGRLYDHLVKQLEGIRIFFDIVGIQAGDDWKQKLDEGLQNSTIILVIIGKQWLSVEDNQGNKRLELDDDPVRFEVSTAIKHELELISVLVNRAARPQDDDLPEDMKLLASGDFVEISDWNFEEDVKKLAKLINEKLWDRTVKFVPPKIKKISKKWKDSDLMALGDVTDIRRGKKEEVDKLPEGDYPRYTPAGIVGFFDRDDFEGSYILVAGNSPSLKSHKKEIVFKPDKQKFSANQHMNLVKPHETQIHVDYLHLILSLMDFSDHLTEGTTLLNASALKTIRIPLPSLDEQQRIVKAYEDGKKSIEKKRAELKELEAKLISKAFSK